MKSKSRDVGRDKGRARCFQHPEGAGSCNTTGCSGPGRAGVEEGVTVQLPQPLSPAAPVPCPPPWPQRDSTGRSVLAADSATRTRLWVPLRPLPGSFPGLPTQPPGPRRPPGAPLPAFLLASSSRLTVSERNACMVRVFSVGFRRDTARHQLHAPTAPVDPDPTAFTRQLETAFPRGGAALTSRARTSRR